MKLNVSRTKGVMRLSLDVPPNVQHITDIYEQMRRLEYNREVIEIAYPEADQPDLSFVQLLYALKKELFSDNQKIRLIGALDELQKSLILGLLNNLEFRK